MLERRAVRTASWASLGIAMVVPPLLFNGAFGWAVVVTTALALVALGLAVWTTPAPLRGKATVVGAAVVAAFAITAFQALPLPIGWTRALAPEAAEAAVRAAELVGDTPPRFAAISLDPGGTRERTLTALAIAAMFLAGALKGASNRARVLRLGALAVLAVVVVTAAHALADAEHIYGFHTIRFAAGYLPSPLVNPNHLGGFCAFGAILALGLAADAEAVAERGLCAVLAVAASALVFATLSRGAIVSLAVGVLSAAALVAWKARRRPSRRAEARAFAVTGVAIAMLATASFVGFDTIADELASDDYEKVGVQRRALSLAAVDHPLLGVGRGAFAAAMAPRLDGARRFVHPENLPVQWAVEWGLPFAAVLLATLVVALGGAAVRSVSASRTAGLCAVIALGLQNLVDFGLEMAGEAVVVAGVVGALLHERRDRSGAPGSDVRSRRRSGLLRSLTLASGVVALAILGPSVANGGALELERRMGDAVARGDHARVRALLREAAPLHPLAPSFPLLAAAAAVAAGDASAPRLLNRAMELAPLWAAPHEVAARLLASRGRVAQALLELREAEERVPGSAVRETCAVLRAHPGIELSHRAAPRDPVHARQFANEVARCLPTDSPIGEVLDRELLREAPELAEPAIRSARRALRARDPSRAAEVLEPVADLHQDDFRFIIVLAEARAAAGRTDEATAGLERAAAAFDRREGGARHLVGRRRILHALALAHARAGHADAVGAAIRQLTDLASGSPVELARAAVAEGRAEEMLDHPHAAIRAYRRADGYDPSSGALERAARLAYQKGHRAQSYQLYSTLCLRNGPESPACARRARPSPRRLVP